MNLTKSGNKKVTPIIIPMPDNIILPLAIIQVILAPQVDTHPPLPMADTNPPLPMADTNPWLQVDRWGPTVDTSTALDDSTRERSRVVTDLKEVHHITCHIQAGRNTN